MTTKDPSTTSDSPPDDEFQAFLAEYLARIERDGSAALDDLRARHPEFASRLGHQLEWLVEHLGRKHEGLPERIGPYRVVQLLGTGGMGAVYLAEQTTPFRRPVAVKVIKVGEHDAARTRRFEVEIQLLALLNHNSIAKIFEAGSDHGRPYFAMEYVPGKSLTAYCAEERLGVAQRLQLFLEVCSAVAHAHRQGIMHRDLKPSNILVYGPASQPVVKIIDFGLAKLVAPAADAARHTQTAQIVGTPDYMSPEQVDDTDGRRVDTRADVYALGVVLYELLTGVLPLSLCELAVKDIQAVVKAIREREPSSPSVRVEESGSGSDTSPSASTGLSPHRLSRQLAGDLDSIVMKALAKAVDRRYGTVTQLAEDIERYLRHQPVSARPATRLYVLRKFLRRHRLAAGFATTLAVLIVGSLVTINLYALENIRNLERGNLFGLAGYLDELRDDDALPLPPHPEHQASRAEWMRRFDMLLSQRERMRAFLATPEVAGDDPTSRAGWADGSFSDRMLRGALVRTLDVLTQMTAPGAEADKMRLRMQWATTVREQTVDAHAADWARVRTELADDLRFAGIDLQPQIGLVPLGKNEFGLQEFALPLPGADMPTLVGGRYVIADRTCPVFVLLPGGDAILVGSQKDDANADHFDPERGPFEQQLKTVAIEPFFASKYEFTNGQWRLLNSGPVAASNGNALFAPRNPLIGVNGGGMEHVANAWGMRLPTSREWDHLARGGTVTARWCGSKLDSLQGQENVYDQSLVGKPDVIGEGEAVGWSDDFPLSAPVGSLAPNGFGLYDVLGNVMEVALCEADDGTWELRGGSWHEGAKAARSTSRIGWPGHALPSVGFRPVISLQR